MDLKRYVLKDVITCMHTCVQPVCAVRQLPQDLRNV